VLAQDRVRAGCFECDYEPLDSMKDFEFLEESNQYHQFLKEAPFCMDLGFITLDVGTFKLIHIFQNIKICVLLK